MTNKEVKENQKTDEQMMQKALRIAPSKREILRMPKEYLLQHNALIFHKASSLSSAQRRMVQERVAYGLNKNTITTEREQCIILTIFVIINSVYSFQKMISLENI